MERRTWKSESKYFLLYLCAFSCDTVSLACTWGLPFISALSIVALSVPKHHFWLQGLLCYSTSQSVNLAFLVPVLLYLNSFCITSTYQNRAITGSNQWATRGYKLLLSKLMELLARWLKLGCVGCRARQQSIAQSIWGKKIREVMPYFNFYWVFFYQLYACNMFCWF